ncbi:NAD(P)/FAD-dependent oxidoreductase [Pseudoteredinibacter isoporae]|uniref:Glycine/D-amino acid oxidase-like deaminating enzyme n=1 Tax=Pseudoteredinibacter isoporae TaxID=570281 RepID=A0A7X0JSD8_9GAMM|nr:FAD-dependent oxidoreductase [Pseudoteredinibacter isoporae]MBB6521287.1 glycine/D-amino acid oxidase-like deaminating enzyme [Pseudoteredinibacter isoporae]NHO86845.1 FAD-binding oxidoreductase [Pseudoteredinibacter isoporae]NIB24703.1 FAD-binding oxidoreductase [Pseudoteredinibacter isoporae]
MSNSNIKSFSATSFWFDSIEPQLPFLPSLEGDQHYDVAIIGGGFTGLSTAIALRERNVRVAIIEKGRAGSGASGRNSGHVGCSLGMLPLLTYKNFGEERTRQLSRVVNDAVDNVEHMIAQSGADCDYNQCGNIMAAVSRGEENSKIEKYAALFEKMGIENELLDQNALQKKGIPECVVKAAHWKKGGVINPVKYARCLTDIALAKGVVIYENSEVEQIIPGKKVTIVSDRGNVFCDKAVLATNAYSGELGFLKHKIIPMSVSVFVSDPLTVEQRARLDWQGGEGITTAHMALENIRLTADNRILIGSKSARLGFGTSHPTPNDSLTFSTLNTVFRDRLPELSDVNIDVGWTGRVAISSDGVPSIGTLSKHNNIYYGVGYSGHGIAMASNAGNVIAKLMCGEDLEEAQILVNRKALRVPPEPFRWIVGRSVMAAMKGVDKKIDRNAKLERRSSTSM